MDNGRKAVLRTIALAVLCASVFLTAGRALRPQQAPATPPPAALPSRISPKAQQLLDQAVQALGGPAFLTFKNISTSGRVFGFSNGEMAGVEPFKSIYAPPDKRRFTYGKGKSVTLINNGDEAWELDQYGLAPQLPEQVREWKLSNHYSLDNLLRSVVKESGVLVLDHGVDFVANQPAYVIDITDAQNVQLRLYLRKDNYLPLRVTYSLENPRTQDRDEYVDDYSDYQRFDGIMTPMNVVRTLNGDRIGAAYRNRASYNVSVPANYFQPSQ